MPKKQPASTVTSGELSRIAGLPLQTIIRWDRAGILTGQRGPEPRAPRRYDENALVAAMFAHSLSEMGFAGERLAELVALMQRADPKELRRWIIYSYRTSPGLIGHRCGEAKERAEHVAVAREEKLLIDEPVDLWAVREPLLKVARQYLSL